MYCAISPFVYVKLINTNFLHGYSTSESIPCYTECEKFQAFIGKLEMKDFVQAFQEKYKTKGMNLAKMGVTILQSFKTLTNPYSIT